MKVRGYRLLVKGDPIEKVTKSGIILEFNVDVAEHAQMYGVVEQVGSSCWPDEEPWCKPGDRIAWSKFAGKFVVDEHGEKFVILNDQDVLCTLERDKDE